MDFSAYSVLMVAILLGVIGQLSLKYGMSKHRSFQVKDLFRLIWELPLVFGFTVYGVSTLLYIKALGSLDLSLAYPTVSLSYILTVLFSKIAFQEPVRLARWFGVIVICIGVVLVGLGG